MMDSPGIAWVEGGLLLLLIAGRAAPKGGLQLLDGMTLGVLT
ncbi:unnamed protein product [Timema podura]|uniref:Uncharacterized protein n=1 Tax=Timema podura TaxID=61482 RepID=A0ABN7NKF2_TIMPD|nr:unnamed protein product [Timema podura]